MRGASYSDTIKSALAEERATKTSIEQRGVGIVTTSGVLATLLFGFGAFVYGSKSPNISSEGTGFLITSVVLFVVAATFGLLANRPAKYREADIPSLRERTEKEEWHKPSPAEAARRELDPQRQYHRSLPSNKRNEVDVCIYRDRRRDTRSQLRSLRSHCDIGGRKRPGDGVRRDRVVRTRSAWLSSVVGVALAHTSSDHTGKG